MFDSIRNKLGIAGLLVAVVALVAALGGSAVAAGGGSGDATASAKKRNKGGNNVNRLIKREARKFSKAFSLRFAKRFPGPIGPQGFPGLPGAPGEDGDDGDDGDDGSDGAKGATGATGDEGPTGPTGPEGSPWTEVGTLPSGETLKGTWSAVSEAFPAPFGVKALVSIAYNIPLASSVPMTYVPNPEVEANPDPTNCPGSASDPQALAGHLCVYEHTKNASSALSIGPDNSVGRVFLADAAEAGLPVLGSYAVTAE